MSNPESEVFSSDSSQFLRIPLKRIGAVIGLKGANKEIIEGKTQTMIIIDSDTGEVEVRPNKDLKDPVLLIKAREIVRAIGRGFSVEQAIVLCEDDYYLEIIRLKPIIGERNNRIRRVRGRVIGSNGKTKASIEELTGVKLTVTGSTVSIIGTFEQVGDAKESILDIINGAEIAAVLGRLEDKRTDLKKSERELWKSEDDEPTMSELFPEEEEEDDPFANYDGSKEPKSDAEESH